MGTDTNLQVNLHTTLTGHRQSVYALVDYGDDYVISAGGDGLVVKWQPGKSADGVVLASVPEPVYCLARLGDGAILAGAQSGDLYVVKDAGARRFKAHKSGLFGILPDGDGFITIGGDGNLMQWTLRFEIVRTVNVSARSLRRLINAAGGYFTAGSDGVVRELDADFRLQRSWAVHQRSVFALAWIPENAILISAGRDAQLQFHQPFGDAEIESIPAHLLHIHDLKLSPNGKLLASASMDKTIKIWNAESFNLLKVMDAPKFGIHTSSVNALVWLNDTTLVSASDDRKLGVWSVEQL